MRHFALMTVDVIEQCRQHREPIRLPHADETNSVASTSSSNHGGRFKFKI